MANEPELHPLTSDEWVAYLKQLMQHWGYWSGDSTEEFTEELAEAVRGLQGVCGIAPADGVVRADTWAILTGETAASREHEQGQQPHGGAEQHGDQHGDHGVHATQTPATFDVGGAPAFEYSIEPVPIAEYDVSTPEYDAHVELSVTGSVKVAFPGAAQGATVSTEGLEVEASQTVQGLSHGIQVSGLGSEDVSIGDTWGSEYAQSGFSLGMDGAMTFHGQVQVHHVEATQAGEAEVEGTLGYELKVTIVPHPTPEVPEPVEVTDEQSWFERHRTLTLVGVAVVLVAVGVAVTLSTAGTGTAPAEAATWGALGAAGAL